MSSQSRPQSASKRPPETSDKQPLSIDAVQSVFLAAHSAEMSQLRNEIEDFDDEAPAMGEGELSLADLGYQVSEGSDDLDGSSVNESAVQSPPDGDLPESRSILEKSSLSHTGRVRARSSSNVSRNSDADVKVPSYSVASGKRNKEFHKLFRSVPEHERLIEDYGCALSREILLQGRLYVSQNYICFNSNIFGWVTNLVIAFADIVSIEKKTTAGLFPNAIVVQTLHARNVFASFISRDVTYRLLVNVWRGEETVPSGNYGDQISDSDSQFSDSDESITDDQSDSNTSSKVEETGQTYNMTGGETADGMNTVLTEGGYGPTTHPPTELHLNLPEFSKDIATTTIQAPLGKVASLLFGPQTDWLVNFIQESQKCRDLSPISEWKKNANGKVERHYEYVKPLDYSIGPKSTRCIATETREAWDFEEGVCVVTTTKSPDVPSGNIFDVKTKFELTWADGNATKIVCTCQIEWSGKSWIKGPIEKGTIDGQKQYFADLIDALKSTLISRGKKGSKSRKKSTRPKSVNENNGATKSDADAGIVSRVISIASSGLNTVVGLGPLALLCIVLTLAVLALTVSKVSRGLGDSPVLYDKWEKEWDAQEKQLWKTLQSKAPMSFDFDYDTQTDFDKAEVLLFVGEADRYLERLKQQAQL
ncbi:hypothetical protein CANCADRAFT_57438 [Tortispora caseinolytica NRRL Y-17796]|uniref:VASt domain-containing protein n=1 Tax=Tortispora caseinolytica NRRL Y-17796 TaxID=767744 RepID=A0A1E4TH42_9ASCO|nr:hypothetical protein CANCADRAFT_57438 [Tortispora caseinolytica NRRL Y-17796]